MENIKTFEDACNALKISPALPGVSALSEKHQKAITAHYMLVIIAEAINLNEDGTSWTPDFNDCDENKYYPWFESSPSGFGFSHTLTNAFYVRTNTNVGPRLCFKTFKLATYVGRQFEQLYKDYFLVG